MRKLLTLITLLFFSFLISLLLPSVIAAACVPDRQSCDQNNICCNFPDTLCRGGYCEPPPNPTCGKQNTSCCDSPNPRCISGLVCSGGYCSSPTPTPTPPTCGVYQYQPCCPSEPKCFGALECRNGTCYPKVEPQPKPPTPTSGPTAAPSPNQGNLCCPAGYATGWLDCPFGTDTSKNCCRRYGFLSYEVVSKIPCGQTSDLKNCCPVGFGTGDFDCPFGTDRTKKCCKRTGFSQYQLVDKVECTPGTTIGSSGANTCVTMGTTGLLTAIGCIPTVSTTNFVLWFLRFAIGIGGGIAFLLMLFGVFQIITSSGNPERLKAGQETITSAVIGLLMIIFSLFLLRLIGIEILQIFPGG